MPSVTRLFARATHDKPAHSCSAVRAAELNQVSKSSVHRQGEPVKQPSALPSEEVYERLSASERLALRYDPDLLLFGAARLAFCTDAARLRVSQDAPPLNCLAAHGPVVAARWSAPTRAQPDESRRLLAGSAR